MLEHQTVCCPYCGESFETNIDVSGGGQEYVEDCYICCRPIVFSLTVDDDGKLLSFDTRQEND